MATEVELPQLGDLVADAWLEERHSRELKITNNPVELGASITDHAYLEPRSLSLRFGVSNISLNNDPESVLSRCDEVRDRLYAMQDNRELLNVDTLSGGKYIDCLVKSINFNTDKSNLGSIVFDLTLQEVLITSNRTLGENYNPREEDTRARVEPTKKRGNMPANELDAKADLSRVNTRDRASSSTSRSRAVRAKQVRSTV